MFYHGLICDIDPSSGYVKVNIPDIDIVTEFIPFIRQFAQHDKQSIPVAVNELVVVGKTEFDYWFVLGAITSDVDKPYSGANNDKFGVSFSDGTLIEYDKAKHEYTITTVGKVKVTAQEIEAIASHVTITAPAIDLIGAVNIGGVLTAAAGVSFGPGASVSKDGVISTDADIKAKGVSLIDHVHPVSPGSPSTGKPIII